MIVKEFLQSLSLDDLVKAYCLYENDICNYHGTGDRKFHEDADAVKKAFEKILSLEPIIDENSIVFSIPELGTQSLDSFIVKKEELFDTELERIEHYGYEFDSMREILGYQISKACRFQINDDLLYACSILFELTFFGYDPDYQEHETSKNIDELNEQIEEIKNGTAELITSDELFEQISEKYDIDLTDKRCQKEIQFDEKMRSFWCSYYNDLIEELYDLERYYQK